MLISDDRGVWLTIRGSSILQLWDAHTLTCRLLFDVKDNKYPRSPRVSYLFVVQEILVLHGLTSNWKKVLYKWKQVVK